MSERTRTFLALVLVSALALTAMAASGCTKTQAPSGGGTTATTPQKGGTLSYYIAEPDFIDPYNASLSEDAQVDEALFDSLTAFDPLDATKILPAAAEKWESNADATVWTFHLNKNGKFHDGTPVTAKDFTYAWNRMVSQKTVDTTTKKVNPSVLDYHLAAVKGHDEVLAGKATEMSGLKAVDDYTLEVTLNYPFGDFEYVVGHPALAPVPKTSVEGGVDFNGTKVAFGDMPIGNGPLKMAEPWKHGQFIKTVRNTDYYQPQTLVDGVDFRIFKDSDTAYLEFQAGNLDFSLIGTGKIKEAAAKYGEAENGYTSNPGKQTLLGPELSTYFLDMNNTVLKSKDFRRALSLAVNRQAICDVVFQGTRTPADNIVPPGIAGYEKGLWADARYDKAGAEQALAAAGFPGGKGAPAISLGYNGDNSDHQKVMELVQADLKAIGLNVKLAPTPDFGTYTDAWKAGKEQAGRMGWSADYPIMDNFLYPLFNSKSGDNYAKYSNPAVDTALADARKIVDSAQRLKAYNAIDKTVGADIPIAPLMFYRHNYVLSSRVHDCTFGAMNLMDFTKVWISAAPK